MRISDWSSDVCSSDLTGWFTGLYPFPANVRFMDMNFPHRRTRGTTWQISFLGDKAPDLSILLAVASARQAACPTARFLAAEAGGPDEEDIVHALAQVFAPRANENIRKRRLAGRYNPLLNGYLIWGA